MPFDVAAAVAAMADRFRREGTPERAVNEKRYLKSDLQFYGMTVPGIRQAAKDVCQAHPDLTRQDLIALSEICAVSEWHEMRSIGIAILERFVRRLEVADLPMLERHLAGYDTWAHVDWLAPKVVGDLILRHPEQRALMHRWAVSPVMWVRRSALLAVGAVMHKGQDEFPLFVELARPMLAEREFFIAKAIGWVLREVSKKRPELTAGFLAQAVTCSAVTWREAITYLPEAMKAPLAAARAAAKTPARVKG